ncbi:sugar ABC transporter substrate-binding protein [Ornithinimicrobium sp. CNJ-824]|uniref:ABC transporter substrate-binding protein n=1 Tax=Ornithinimicrobium sp. CNJ-824 TaxID=1904966 RepID=UPI00096028D7|nr:ABC transporter substrate-binding protein [Ornithinimicrobium sp. CNJ-824]OLT22137.1 sugar ABC transporter substrate-binding protein [Ornithinimicrobium sp. CNJ-824]
MKRRTKTGRSSTIFALVAAGSLVLAACGNGDSGGSSDDGGGTAGGGEEDASEVQVMTWWAQGSEKAGLEALVEVFNEQHPDTEFVNAALAGGGGSQAKQKLQADLQAENPPDTFQAHAGAELQDYIDAGQIEDVSNLYDEFGLTDVFPETLMEQLTVDDKIYSIPSNVHRSNVTWVNPAVLEEVGIDPSSPPADLDAWMADMEKVADAGKIPVSLGMDWTQTHLLENILLSELGPEAYNGLWDGSTDWGGSEVNSALTKFGQIVEWSNTDRDGLDWEPALQQVMEGNAAYNVMGDWAVAAYDAQDMTGGEDYLYWPVPGTDGIFNYLADSFTLPVGAPHPGGTKAWLDTISSAEGQLAFNTVKGSIPARTDIDAAEFPEYQQSAMEDFSSDTIVGSLAHGAAAPVAVSTAVNQAIVKFSQGASDVDTLQQELVAATDSLGQ